MSAPGSIIRLFVSSTFADFAVERDVLQRMVFPRIRQLCAEQGFRFQPIDLRWGVSREAGNEKRTLTICFEEISRCQQLSPDLNFLILLGDRYGSCFLPASIPSTQVTRLLPHLDLAYRALFDSANPDAAYREDLNAVPAEYVLLPAPPIGRDEESLRLALGRAARAADFSAEEVLPFEASATHLEIQRGLLAEDADPRAVLCAFRKITSAPKGSEAHLYAEQNPAQVKVLRSAIEGRLGERPVLRYRVPWHAGRPVMDHEKLSAHLLGLLEPRVQAVIAQRQQAAEGRDAVTEVNRRFVAERTTVIEGRDDELAQGAAYLDGDVRQPLVVTGASGAGKSSLLARAAVDAARAYPQAVIVARYIGITPKTSNLSDLLNGLRHEIAAHYGQPTPETISDLSQLVAEVAQDLKTLKIPADRPLFLLIDAFDQLSTQPQRMDWLPHALSSHIRVVISVLPDRQELATLRGWLPEGQILTLGPLTREQGATVMQHLLNQEGRQLQPVQERAVLAGFAPGGNPLYLRLAVERARHWRSFDVVPTLPDTLAELVRDLFIELSHDNRHGPVLVAHALGDLGVAKNGLAEDEVLDVLGQDGQVSDDLHRLSLDSPRVEVERKLPLPAVLWARLYADFEPYLTEREADRSSLITFYHRQLLEVVEERYLHDENGLLRHRALADYFGAQPRIHGEKLNSRRLSELPYQQAHSIPENLYVAMRDPSQKRLRETLTDATFLEDKITDQGVPAALGDLALLPGYEQINTISTAIRAGAVVLQRKPDELANQVQGRTGHIEYLHNISSDRPTLRLFFPSLAADPALVSILTGHTGAVNACAFSRDGARALSASSDQSLRLWDVANGETMRILQERPSDVIACVFHPDGHRAVCGYWDGAVQVWDVETAEILLSLPPHTAQVTACAFSADGRLMLSASRDDTVRIWDTTAWQIKHTLSDDAFPGGQNDCAFSPDSHLALSASDSGALQLWDVETGALIRRLELSTSGSDPIVFGDAETGAVGGFLYSKQPVLTCAFHPDGRRALSGSSDGVLRIWDVMSEKLPVELHGHSDAVTGCAFSPDGRLVLSGARDNTLRVWDGATGECRILFKGHADRINRCTFSSDGRLVLSASEDCSLRLWEVAKGRSPYVVFQGQTGPVSSCAFGPRAKRAAESAREREAEIGLPLHFGALRDPLEGALAASASQDGSLWIWSLEEGNTIQFLRRHLGSVIGCAFSPDGQHVFSASTDETLREWELRSGKTLRTLKADVLIRSCAFSIDGHWALTAPQYTGSIQIWDLVAGQVARVLEGLDGAIENCALSRDGTLIAAVSKRNTIQVWRRETGEVLQVIKCDADALHGCAFSPDGRLLLVAQVQEIADSSSNIDLRVTRASTLHLLDIASGRWASEFGHRSDIVQDLTFSPEGRFVLDASRGGALSLWDVASGARVTSWLTDATLTACAFGPDGSHVMAGDTSGGVHFLKMLGLSTQVAASDRSDHVGHVIGPERHTTSERPHRWMWWRRRGSDS